jgi:ArsR family transcriptional regulator
MTTEDRSLASLVKPLVHPARFRILRLLQSTPGSIGGDFVEAVGLAQSTVSEHLRILKAAGVISAEIDGPRICPALNPAALAPLVSFTSGLTPPPQGSCCLPVATDTA